MTRPLITAPVDKATKAAKRAEEIRALRGKANRTAAEGRTLLDHLVDALLDGDLPRAQGRRNGP